MTTKLRRPSARTTAVLAKNIVAYRERWGLSQEAFASKCGLHRTYVGSVERGERNVTLSTLELFASVMAVPVRALFSEPRRPK